MQLEIPSSTWKPLDETREGVQVVKSQHFQGFSSRCSERFAMLQEPVSLFKPNRVEIFSVNIELAA
jgi:hypothetical protein